jgi:hypothetical protein
LVLGSPAALIITALHLPLVDVFIRREERQLGRETKPVLVEEADCRQSRINDHSLGAHPAAVRTSLSTKSLAISSLRADGKTTK